jgi:esterase
MSIDLFYRQYGNPNAPVMVILHGQLGSSRNWTSLAKVLGEYFNVYTLDLRNHGDSSHHPQMDYLSLEEDLLRFADKHHIPSMILVGHSLGGKTAMGFACHHSDYVERLAILDISPKVYNPHHEDIFAGMSAVDLNRLTSRQEADEILKEHIPNIGMRQFVLTNLVRTPEDKFEWQVNLEALIQNKNIVTLNPLKPKDRYEGPTLFIRGEESSFMEDADEATIKQHFPHSSIANFPKVGHNVHIENKELFLRTLLEFCDASY